MSAGIVVPPDTARRQREAADPQASAWVSANAGAGKTKVLADRVIRLLLAGVEPSRILCLTFTKAAAAEMTIRVFKELGRWVVMDKAALADTLDRLTGDRPGRAELAEARRLFARAVETPGGLKIETIHAFCERILHLVPFEANVPARFAVLDETQTGELMAEARARVLTQAATGGPLAEALATASLSLTGDGLTRLIDVAALDPAVPGDAVLRERASARLRRALGVQPGRGSDAIRREMLDGAPPAAELRAMAGELRRTGKSSDADQAAALEAAAADGGAMPSPLWGGPSRHRNSAVAEFRILSPKSGRPDLGAPSGVGVVQEAPTTPHPAPPPPRLAPAARLGPPHKGEGKELDRANELRLAAYLSGFFTDKGDPKKSLATKGVAPAACEWLVAERERLVILDQALRAAETVERTEALYRLAGAVREAVGEQKRRLGALDFADLITKTLQLLERDSAVWVLYRLDRGIDHVLVDEAQDTNPDQWRILRLLTAEFTAGAGRPLGAPRTLFAVGDPKQSIYSFQGAEPREFETSRRDWRSRVLAAEGRFNDVRLDLSFRSAPAILAAVDATFGVAAHHKGLSFDATVTGTSHTTARPKAPGHVELWPTVLPLKDKAEPEAWTLPVDLPAPNAPALVVADRIARAVKLWTTAGDPETGRVWRPGEVLILVRSRGPAFFAVIRALKARGVPVAGADRFDIGEHIAVTDLVAAGAAALLPANDLALAAALKSPLVGLDDDDLIRLAADRGEAEPLAAALARCAAAGDAGAGEAHDALTSWRDLAARHGPFGFYAALLGPGGGRRRLIERLGSEAADAIDAFLSFAQTAETGPETPSLTGFLARFESAAHVIRRDFEAGGDEVKVMTVHGAKGLEASLVVVIDGCETAGRDPPLIPLAVGGETPLPVWSPGRKSDCEAVAAAREAAKELRLEEHNRLLYVAMTRAADRLVVAPFVAMNAEPKAAWGAMVREACGDAFVQVETPHGPAAIWRDPIGEDAGAPLLPRTPPPDALPDWLTSPAAIEAEPLPPIRPSGALAAADRAAASRVAAGSRAGARRRGALVHAAIDHLAALPLDLRAQRAELFVAARAPALADDERRRIAADALAVLAHPDLAALFGPGSRGEAPIAGAIRLPDGSKTFVSGQIDRFAVVGSEVLLAEFKTGERRRGAPIRESYLAQLALYRALLVEIHWEKSVRAALIFTAGPDVVFPSAAELDRALTAALRPAPVPAA